MLGLNRAIGDAYRDGGCAGLIGSRNNGNGAIDTIALKHDVVVRNQGRV